MTERALVDRVELWHVAVPYKAAMRSSRGTLGQGEKIVLRIVGFLAVRDEEFKARLAHSDFMDGICICAASGDAHVSHWASCCQAAAVMRC